MKHFACLLILVTFWGASLSPAAGDVDVHPKGSLDPRLQINGSRYVPPRVGPFAPEMDVAEVRPWERYIQCPVDPEVGTYGCRTYEPDDDDADLTQADILRAVREIGLPRLDVRVQPGTRTLVNAETIFSTDPVPFSRSVQLLGFDVDLDASAVSYTWHHGDGTSRSTASAGRPYPAFDVTHRYRAAQDVRPSVDVTYRVRYRVDGGAWSTLAQTITASGPATTLEVREAAPVLTKP